jgi:ubiquitin-activating enzyme E1
VYKQGKTRDEGLTAVLGQKLVAMAADSRVFMVGAGAIGCELLKNFAMIGLGTG